VKCRPKGQPFFGAFYGSDFPLFQTSAQPVTVVPGADTPNIDFRLRRGAVLTGTASVDGVLLKGCYDVGLFSVTEGRWLFDSTVEGAAINPETGKWMIAVPPGSYKLFADVEYLDVPSIFYGDTYSFGETPVVTVAGTETLDNLDIHFGTARATISGTVRYAGQENGTLIVYLSDSLGNDFPNIIDGEGREWKQYAFSFTLAPGTWYAKAFVDVNRDLQYNAGEPFGEYPFPLTVEHDDVIDNLIVEAFDTKADFDHDGDVDGEDLAAFISHLEAGTAPVTVKEFAERFGW
jgi:hypothetical protein